MKSAFRPLIKRRDAIKRACAAVALSALPCAAAAQDKKFYEKQKSAKTREFDVVVCGGGPAGWAAAVSAARAGARTAITAGMPRRHMDLRIGVPNYRLAE